MFQSDFADDHRDVRAPRRAANRLIAALLVVVLCFCAICVKFLIDSRNSAWRGARETTASLVAAIELDTLLNIESFDLSLQAVVDNLKLPGIDRIDPDLRQLVLFDRSATARHRRPSSFSTRPAMFVSIPGRSTRNRSIVPTATIFSFTPRAANPGCMSAARSPPMSPVSRSSR